jgi:hypothetical protein
MESQELTKHTFRVIIARGKFQGVIAPTTPTGCKPQEEVKKNQLVICQVL